LRRQPAGIPIISQDAARSIDRHSQASSLTGIYTAN